MPPGSQPLRSPMMADLASARLWPRRRESTRPVLDEMKTDRSEASGTGYWNPSTDDYDLELFERALGHPAILPRVLGPGITAGTTVALPGSRVPAGIVVGPGAGDNAARRSAWARGPATSSSRSARAGLSSR
jgi:hypothetical protein